MQDAEALHAEMRTRGLVVMGRRQQTMLFWRLLGALIRDRRQFRCLVHCFQVQTESAVLSRFELF
jgi:hypothetical protein|eukprot:COSAG06_NODE_5001_length_3796_cov_29.826393_1_plen_65_part_00